MCGLCYFSINSCILRTIVVKLRKSLEEVAMQNRICKTLIAFTIAFAVFLSGAVFSVNPNSVFAGDYAAYFSSDNSTLVANGSSIFVYNDEDNEIVVEYYEPVVTVFEKMTIPEGVDLSEVSVEGELNNDSFEMSGGSVKAVSDFNSVSISGGEVGNVSGASIVLSGGDIGGAVTATSSGSIKILLEESGITLSGENAVIGSAEKGIGSYNQSVYQGEAYVIDVTSNLRSVGDIVAYFDINVVGADDELPKTSEDIIELFASDYYTFEVGEGTESVLIEEEIYEYSYYYVQIATSNIVAESGGSSSKITLDGSIKGSQSQEIDEQEAKEEADKALISLYDNISVNENGEYVVSGEYGGVYQTAEEAVKACEDAKTKQEAKEDVTSFGESTFAGTGVEDTNSQELFEEELEKIQETDDGTYVYDGEEYANIQEVTSAVSENVKRESYSRNIQILVDNISSSVRNCDDAETALLYSQGATAIEQLAYEDADRLAQIYESAMDTISVSQNAVVASNDILSVYNLLSGGGILTAESLEILESQYESYIERLSNAQTNSEVASIKSDFEDFILSLDVLKVSLNDENGNLRAMITQSGGMDGASQIVIVDIDDISSYETLLQDVAKSGEVTYANFFAGLVGGNSLEEMQVLSVMDISIDGEHNAENSNGKYTVKLLAPDGVEDFDVIQILHITDEGIELINASVSNGYITWQTPSFSKFVIIGSVGASLWWAVVPISVIALLLLAYYVVAKKEETGDSDVGK